MVSDAVGKHQGQIIELGEFRYREIERWGKISSLIGISTLSLLVIAAFICLSISRLAGVSFESFGFDYFAPIVFTVAFSLIVVGAVLMSYPKIRKELHGPQRVKEVGKANTTSELPASNEADAMTSVTERTTNLLRQIR